MKPIFLNVLSATPCVVSVLTVATSLTSFTVGAQPAATPSAAAVPSVKQLETVTITAAPLGTASTSLSGDELLLRAQGSLGETLNGLPGVSSTYFGPNASRPVIRGQDGDRIRILNNSGATIDVSGLSFDHATPIDVLTAQRVEVLRGPATLMFGGGAIGGLVNVIDSKIARESLGQAPYRGKLDLGFASGGNAKNGGFALDAGTDRLVWHADVSTRTSDDVNAPVNLPCTRLDSIGVAKRICNSASNYQTASVGASLVGRDGYLGSSITRYVSRYGTVAEDNVEIKMKSRRIAIDGEFRGTQLPNFLESVRAQVSSSRYAHTEFDEAIAGTLFSNRGQDYRVEVRQKSTNLSMGKLSGISGVQGESTRFSADGDEAFVPYTKSKNSALFTYQELGLDWGKLSAGVRLEQAKADSLGSPTVTRFDIAQKKFNLASYSMGMQLPLSSAVQLNVNAGVAQRAPKDYELYANGPHIATGAYELGDANLRKEVSRNFELGLKWSSGANKAAFSAYVSNFSNYVFLDGSLANTRNASDGEVNPVEDLNNLGFSLNGAEFDPLPEFRYTQVRARFSGFEANGNWRIAEGRAGTAVPSTLDLQWRADLVRATNLSAGQPLPRIAPTRLGATIVFEQGSFGAQLGADYYAAQSRVAADQLATGSYTLWNAALTWKMSTSSAPSGQVFWYLRADNLTNQLAYSASSILTQTAPGKSPLPGRSIRFGFQVNL